MFVMSIVKLIWLTLLLVPVYTHSYHHSANDTLVSQICAIMNVVENSYQSTVLQTQLELIRLVLLNMEEKSLIICEIDTNGIKMYDRKM